MTWRRRRVAQPPPPRCSVPGCDRPAITGDGPDTPCWPCLFRFGDAARRPEILSDGEMALLLEAHGDVVELLTLPRKGQRWGWKPFSEGQKLRGKPGVAYISGMGDVT